MLLRPLPQLRRAEAWSGHAPVQVAANDVLPFRLITSTSRRRKSRGENQPAADWTAGLSTRSANALRAHGLRNRRELAALPAKALLRIPNLGRASLQELRRWLQQNSPAPASISFDDRGENP